MIVFLLCLVNDQSRSRNKRRGHALFQGDCFVTMDPGCSCVRERTYRHRVKWAALLALLAGLFVSSKAMAVPVSYSVTSGSVNLLVSVDGVVIGTNVSALTNGSFTIDTSAQSLDDFSITLEPDLILNLSTSYGGYDTVTIESATLSAQPGFSSTVIATASSSYTVLASPLGVVGSWAGLNSGGVPPPVDNSGSMPVSARIASASTRRARPRAWSTR